MASKKLPEDYAIDALAEEALRRRTTYGKLVAKLGKEERDRIVEEYSLRHGKRRSKAQFLSVNPKRG